MKKTRRKLGIAFTLIEALLAAIILAMAITAITMPFTAGAQSQANDAKRTLAVSLAQDMMEEILSKPFADPGGVQKSGPETGEITRSLFDNMDDYDGYKEAEKQIVDSDGQLVNDQAAVGLSRSVTATYVYVAGQDTNQPSTFLRVTVEVSYKGTPVVTLSRLVFANR
ncbi:MAG: hypothetical protein EHM48_01370 [Planctomycetaceae bacterium]|nr:MAG: hypothetical protein EHM48_01370 [Planctomycetaceae bacterium]